MDVDVEPVDARENARLRILAAQAAICEVRLVELCKSAKCILERRCKMHHPDLRRRGGRRIQMHRREAQGAAKRRVTVRARPRACTFTATPASLLPTNALEIAMGAPPDPDVPGDASGKKVP